MDQLLKEKIGRHKKELEGSDLHPETKEHLSPLESLQRSFLDSRRGSRRWADLWQ